MSRIYSLYKNFRGKRYAYLLSYTLVFCFTAILMFWYFPAFHKSFIWQQDGLKQHYNGLLYYAKYLRGILSTLINEHRLSLPMWDHSVGYGSDIITTFHYYAIGDPLTLLSVFVPLRFMEFFYAFLFFLRSFIGGLGFSLISLNRGNSRFYTLTGAMIYCFSAFALVLGLMHGIFMIPVCYFPWMIYGTDRIFNNKPPVIFILSVAAAAAANFYFLYMEVLLTVFYILHKFISEERDRYGVRQSMKTYAIDLLKRFGQFLLYGINAFFLSAVILLPVLSVFFSSGRFAAEKYVPLLYPLKHYLQLVANFMISRRGGSWTLMGFTAVGALAVLMLFSDSIEDKEIKRLRFRFSVLTVFAMIPFFGFMLNGFAYVVNRWTFAWALSAAMVTATMLSRLNSFDPGRKGRLIKVLAVLTYLSAAFFFVRSEESLLSTVLLLVLVLILLRGEIPRGLKKGLILIVTFMSLFLNGWYSYSTAEDGMLDEFLDFHRADMLLNDESYTAALNDTGDASFYRTELYDCERTQNSSVQTGLKGTQYYFSLTSPYISDFINALYLNWPKDYDYEGVESREGLEALAAVKYCFAGENAGMEVPRGFQKIAEKESTAGKAELYENENSLPLGYTVDSFISRSAFDRAEVTGRQSALLTGAVISDEDAAALQDAGYEETAFSDDSVNVLKSIEKSGDMDLGPNFFTVRRNGGVSICFDGSEDSETYLFFTNLRFQGYKEREIYDKGAWAGLTPYEQAKVRDKNTTDGRPGSSSMMVSLDGRQQIIEFYNNRQDYYCGRHDFLINLGNTGKGEKTLEISFREPGVYTFDALEIRSQPLSSIEEKLERLRETTMSGTGILKDAVNGRIKTDRNKLLMLSIPYSTGWKAFIDGREERIFRAGLMYMAVPVTKGEHSVYLKYETPYLKTGAILSIIGIIMFFVISFYETNAKRPNGEKK